MNGLIESCKKLSVKCKYKCCKFKDNYILLFPGEIEATKLNVNHLKIINENYFGGKKAVCLRHCSKKDFKPLDCKIYPFFPKITKQWKIKILKGIKCLLSEKDLVEHKKIFYEVIGSLVLDEKTKDFIKKVKLVGYKKGS